MKPFCNSVHNLPLSVGLAKCPQQHCVQEQTKGGMSHSDGKNHQWTSCSCCVHHWSLFEAGCWSMQTSGFAQPAAIYSYLGFCYSEQLFNTVQCDWSVSRDMNVGRKQKKCTVTMQLAWDLRVCLMGLSLWQEDSPIALQHTSALLHLLLTCGNKSFCRGLSSRGRHSKQRPTLPYYGL